MTFGRDVSVPVRAESELVREARALDLDRSARSFAQPLADAADRATRDLIDGFVHEAGPAPGRFAWVALGSHARAELHCASDQDHAIVWEHSAAAATTYSRDLADTVIEGLVRFGLRRCSGGYMADRWAHSLADWVALLRQRVEAPTPDAVLDADVLLDLRPVSGDLDVSPALAVLQSGADSQRLMHGLAVAANSFPLPLLPFGRLPRQLDLKRVGLAPLVLLARVYGLAARSASVATADRLTAAGEAGVLSRDVARELAAAFDGLTRIRLANQLRQIDAGEPITDVVMVGDLPPQDQAVVRESLRAVKSLQAVTSVRFRTDLDL